MPGTAGVALASAALVALASLVLPGPPGALVSAVLGGDVGARVRQVDARGRTLSDCVVRSPDVQTCKRASTATAPALTPGSWVGSSVEITNTSTESPIRVTLHTEGPCTVERGPEDFCDRIGVLVVRGTTTVFRGPTSALSAHPDLVVGDVPAGSTITVHLLQRLDEDVDDSYMSGRVAQRRSWMVSRR